MTTPPPLPEAKPILTFVDRKKLPPDVAFLADPAAPLPAGVQFFERRFTTGGAIAAGAWAVGLAVLGVITILVGISWAIETSKNVTVSHGTDLSVIGFGLVCGLIAWVMVGTARDRLRLQRQQAAGQITRAGLFLTADTLIDSDGSAWTLVPRANVVSVGEGAVMYRAKDQTKRTPLPEFFSSDRAAVEQAIAAWRHDAGH